MWPPVRSSRNASPDIAIEEFLAFLRHLDRNVPATLDVHLIIDNYDTHKHAKVRAWLAARPRTTFTTPQPTPPGSIKSSAGLPSSPNKAFAAAPCKACVNSSPTSITTSTITNRSTPVSSRPHSGFHSRQGATSYVTYFRNTTLALHAGKMLPGDPAEGHRGTEGDTGTGIRTAHDARHVIARHVQAGDRCAASSSARA